MKISKNIEPGIYVLLLLATQTHHTPLKSHTLSQILQVSDSSLKKVLRKLVVHGLITSTASKDGGFVLRRPLTDITLLDVMHALEGPELLEFQSSHLAQQIFPDKAHTAASEVAVTTALAAANAAYEAQLAHFYLSSIIKAGALSDGLVDWEAH
ncbi:MAG: Rrf2 family transcriptional regulator [Lactobacillus sp.]|jgi:Rrf2 family protein|nr:Rrf2 family transcriptional regulator [Lactobacillus sp.]MCI2032835.1 Rrf2 family transcriptional regulator [Lactobacillus sp.]